MSTNERLLTLSGVFMGLTMLGRCRRLWENSVVMLKYCLYIAATLFAIPVNAQDTPKIKGIGDIILNQTTISALPAILQTEIKDMDNNNSNDYFIKYRYSIIDKESKAVENKNSDKEYKYSFKIMSEENFIPGYRFVRVTKYTIADIEIPEIELTFFNDTLIKLKSNYTTKMSEALAYKYGKPETSNTSKKVSCVYKMTGNTVEMEEWSLTEDWTNENIKASGTMAKYYDDKCKDKFLTYFILEDVKKTETFTEMTKKKRQELKDKEAADKAEKYKTF